LLDLIIPETVRSVIIHHSNSLHERVTNGWTHKPEPALAQLLAHRVRLVRRRRNLAERAEPMLDGLPANKSPDVLVERAEFFACNQDLFSVSDRRLDLQSVTNNPSVTEKTLDISVQVTSNFRRLEIVECLAIVYSFVQNRLPGQSCLRTLQRKKLKQRIVFVDGDAPFHVMIFKH
jgi:hypothetical protein